MESLQMELLADVIYQHGDSDDIFRTRDEVEKCLGSNLRRINLKEKYLAVYRHRGIVQIETFDEIRNSNKIGADALILKTKILERYLDEKIRRKDDESGLFQHI